MTLRMGDMDKTLTVRELLALADNLLPNEWELDTDYWHNRADEEDGTFRCDRHDYDGAPLSVERFEIALAALLDRK